MSLSFHLGGKGKGSNTTDGVFMVLKLRSAERETVGKEGHVARLKREGSSDFGLSISHCTVWIAVSWEASAQIRSVCI